MRPLYAVLLLCLGCASGAEYQRGAYRQPARAQVRAPTTNPTTDAPRYAPPGRAPQPGVYPRTPYTRVLPPTREPGIWASDATGEEPSVTVDVLEHPVAIPAPVLPELVTIHANACSAKAALIAAAVFLGKDYTRLTGADRACFSATLMARCLRARAERTLKTDETRERPNRTANLEALAAPVKWANAIERACKQRQHAYKDMLTLMLENWR